jgi:predicted DNA-binding transcriptional regulator AlpA
VRETIPLPPAEPQPRAPEAAAPRVEAALLRARDAAALCGIGLATWWRWDAAGRMPRGVKIGGARLWSREELLDWIRAGCPARPEWQARREADRRAAR